MVRFRSISVDDGAVEVDIGVFQVIKYQTGVMKVRKTKGAEAEESEGEELSLGMAKSDERGLELFEMVESFALFKYGFHGFTQVGGVRESDHSLPCITT